MARSGYRPSPTDTTYPDGIGITDARRFYTTSRDTTERGVPEVFNSTYDIRMLLAASGRLRDGKEIDIPGPAFVRHLLMKELDKTQIGALLREFKLAGGD